MGKRRATSRANKVTKSRDSEYQTREKERQNIVQVLQQVINFDGGTRDSNDAESSLLHTRSTMQMSPKENCTFARADASKRSVADAPVNECYRCQHFLNVPSNLPQPSCERTTGLIGQCEVDISFVQAIVWLKSVTTCVSQLSVEQLQRVFDRQWNRQDNRPRNKSKDNVRRAKRLKRHIEKPSVAEGTDTQDAFSMLTSCDVPNQPDSSAFPDLIAVGSSVTCKKKKIDTLNFVSTSDMHISSAQEKCTDYVTDSKRCEEILSESSDAAVSVMDGELVLNSDWDKFESETFDSWAELQMENEFDKVAKCLTQPASKNCTDGANEEAVENTVDVGNESNMLQMVSGNNLEHVLLSLKTPPFTLAVDQTKKHKPATLAINPTNNQSDNQSDKSDHLFQVYSCFDDDFITPTINQWKPYDESTPTCDYNLDMTLDNISQLSIDMEPLEQKAFDNFRADRSSMSTSNNNKDKFEIKFNDVDKSDTQSYEKKAITCEETAATLTGSPSAIRETKATCKKQSSAKKDERKCPREEKLISAKWLSFTLESLDVEHVILESVGAILSTLSNKRTAKEYATCRYWKLNLKEEAVNTVLNVSDVLRLERKPDICRKKIVTTVIETLNDITTCTQLNETSVSIYRVQIILELCNSVSVSVAIIDHLIERLQSFRSTMIYGMEVRRGMHTTINQLHLVFYALNIALQKYRTVLPNDQKAHDTESAIPHVVDLWKTRYINEELEYARLNVKDAEERWRAALEDFTVASLEHFTQFAEKSQSLAHMLIPQ
ncbi:uncharacterized protein LOC105189055 [Harpegnathos saltator]|uniref:uncharacterized protein LOC105189055 n=1 Tax=Harpegnathos saltator TaxID=610380 RepID=UPI000948C535|nr:uncharacterized protein LOC105189055 [Harpegnathos saltator]